MVNKPFYNARIKGKIANGKKYYSTLFRILNGSYTTKQCANVLHWLRSFQC